MDVTILPTVNAALNATSVVLLTGGYFLVRSGRFKAHQACMLSAFACSVVFLASYLTYHFQVGSVRFLGQGGIRFVYFAILSTHTVLAATVPFLAIVTLYRGLRRHFDKHVAIARFALPIWLYVGVTGVVVYLMLYQLEFG